ncbi:BRCA1 C Terminus (BRCT) domain containing protein [Acanthamoeba castellanii str. Neff]|uniref:BRCA1 C Terminus (BRCT) domain containing protein n=1 Tax=Acanthamoeba castellanii (strain ATCC 30010 / Neff) TaxID=1257118 RepID=L8HE43_ACACF|nr:BRCA1 C Terminus (BRCT) domain containing protein [Acanthamoeba castellanii str. Neff]ELR22641.1 BRCA1 C Terminus (BRCT) domain containing protein [Acanthamoeba castellanii str. Neff]
MDSSYEDSDVELDGNFASASASAGTGPASDPSTIPLSARFLPVNAGTKQEKSAAASVPASVQGAVGTFHEPLVSLSFEGDLEEDEEDEESTVEVIKEEEEEDDDDDDDDGDDEDVQLDNTPAEAAAERRPQHRPPPSVARPPLNTTWACKECTFADNASDSDQCEMCDSSRAAKQPQHVTAANKKESMKQATKPSTPATKETYKKPDPRPPRKVEAKPSVVESQDEVDDDEEDQEEEGEEEEDANSKVEKEESEDEEEDELSLDSDKEFDMPAFSAVLLPDSQSMMLTASTLAATAPGATQRTQSLAVLDPHNNGKPTVPAPHGPAQADEESIVSSDEEEADWPPVKGAVQTKRSDIAKKVTTDKKEKKEEEEEEEEVKEVVEVAAKVTPASVGTPRLAKRKDKGKEKVDVTINDKEKKEKEKKVEVKVVGSSYDLSFPHWDDEEERMRDRDQIKASSSGSVNKKSQSSTPAAKASRAENDFMSYARNRKKSLTSPPSTPTRSPSPPASSSSSSVNSKKKNEKIAKKTKSEDDDDEEDDKKARATLAKTKAKEKEAKEKEKEKEKRWISTTDKESRKATPARRTAQRKNRMIQSSSEDDEDEGGKEKERKKKAAAAKKKKNEGEKKSKASTRMAKKSPSGRRSPRGDEWKEDSDEAEADNHDHDNGDDEDDDDVEEEERVVKPRTTSSKAKASKGKEPADDKGEKTTRKAKRKSMEVPDEDAEAPQFTWRKIEKKMLAEATKPKNADQLFRGLQFIVTGLSGEDDKENDDRSAERINRLIGEEGGKLLGNFANASLASQCKKRSGYPGLPSTILLSAKPRTTLKYLLSVAAGLPTVHYNWLIHCCQQRCLLPHSLYLLPAGYSVEKGSDVFIKKPRGDIFEGTRVEVVGTPEFKNLWKLVLKEGGAKVVERLFTPQEDRVECIVSPPDPDDYLKVKFKKLRVPVVGKQWIIQSLLSQKMADVDDALYNFKNC